MVDVAGEALDVAMTGDFAFIVIAAALMGFLAARTGQPTIIAYIVTGILLGPAVFGLVSPSELTETMAELGLAFLLFLLGIKMRFRDVRDIVEPVVRISLPQMVLVAAAGFGVSIFLGFTVWESVIIGLAVMYSSTAVVIKMLTDSDEATSLHGRVDIGVLLVQDIVVVTLLAVLAAGRPDSVAEVAFTLVTVLVLVAVVGAVAIASSRYLLPRVFRSIAGKTQVFFLTAVSWLFLFLFVSHELDLSIEMGAFLAGIAIAQMPYSKELEARVSPLTDLFILMFFVSVSLELGRADLLEYWFEAVVAAAVLMPVKLVVFLYLVDRQRFDPETTFLASVNMVQVSEFGLVVGAIAVYGGFIGDGVLGFLTLVALLTMAVSVYVIKYSHRLYSVVEPYAVRYSSVGGEPPGPDDHRDHAVVVGFDEISRRAIPLLAEEYDTVVVIDRDIREMEEIEEAGYYAVFGDAKYAKIRKEAGVKHADFVFSSSAQRDVNELLLNEVPDEATVFVEAGWSEEARHLYSAGADFVAVEPELSAEQLKIYVESYLNEPEEFERARRKDIDILSSTELLPDERPWWGDRP